MPLYSCEIRVDCRRLFTSRCGRGARKLFQALSGHIQPMGNRDSTAIIDVSCYPDEMPIAAFGARLRCERCGNRGAVSCRSGASARDIRMRRKPDSFVSRGSDRGFATLPLERMRCASGSASQIRPADHFADRHDISCRTYRPRSNGTKNKRNVREAGLGSARHGLKSCKQPSGGRRSHRRAPTTRLDWPRPPRPTRYTPVIRDPYPHYSSAW